METVEGLRDEPNSPVGMVEYAKHLYNSKDYRGLEGLFGKHLRKSYDLGFWMLYVEYVKKVSQKKFKLHEVYEFTLAQFENYWESYELYKEYIEELGKIEDEQTRIEKTRNAYMRALQIPMRGLSELWRDFEEFELELNKATGKKIVSDTLPIFQSSFQRYQAILPLVKNWNVKNAAKLIDMEMENGSKLSAKAHAARMHFIYNYILNSFYHAEEVYFFYSEYLMRNGQKEDAKKILQKGMEMTNGMFLSLYYGVTMDDEEIYSGLRDRFSAEENMNEELDLIEINHLNYNLKKKGLESFRKLFIDLNKETPGPHVFVYCALVEYYATGNRSVPYNVFSSGLQKHPKSTLLKEEFFMFLLRTGDEENARALFKRLEKTNKMWDAMIEYEYMVGSMELFKDLVEQKAMAIKDGVILPALPEKSRKEAVDGVLGKYYSFLSSFNFFELKVDDSRVLDEFLGNLPQIGQQSNVLSNIKLEKVVDLLRTI